MKNHKLMAMLLSGAVVAALTSSPQMALAGSEGMHGTPPAGSTSDYVLGPDDKVHINVYGEDKLTGDYAVTSAGQIAFPLIGNVNAAGRTLGTVEQDIRQRLGAGYLKDPRVAIEVGTFRSLYILGEVNKPGEYPYRTNLTLEQAVATAGGYTYRANRKRIAIRHVGEKDDTPIKLNGKEMLELQPGDTVRVTERFF